MKRKVIGVVLSLMFMQAHSQTVIFEHTGSRAAMVPRAKLREARMACELIPGYPAVYYASIIDYVSVEISIAGENRTCSAVANNDSLTEAQRQILAKAEMGSCIHIKYRFSYKDSSSDTRGSNRKVKEMEFAVVLGPEVEAAFPGGKDSLNKYLQRNISDKIPLSYGQAGDLRVTISFYIDVDGYVTDVVIVRSSLDLQVDELAIKALTGMPRWRPAEDSTVAVKQKFGITIGRQGC